MIANGTIKYGGSPPASTGWFMATDFAGNIGRVGALAVALGIGYAVIGAPAAAQASTDGDGSAGTSTSGTSSSGTSTSGTSSSGTSTSGTSNAGTSNPATSTSAPANAGDASAPSNGDDTESDDTETHDTETHDTETHDTETDDTVPEPDTAPDAVASPPPSSAPATRKRSTRAVTSCITCRPRAPRPAAAVSAPESDEQSAPAPIEQPAPAPVPAPTPAPSAAPASPEPQIVPDITEPEKAAVPVSAASAVAGQSADTLPDVPVQTPAALALLAWTRRQTAEALLVAESSVTGTPPSAEPTQGAPDQATGTVTGAINGVANQPQARIALSYNVTAGPARGTLVVDPVTGVFSYTPSAAARMAAGITSAPDYDTFSVSVSDGVQATAVTVTVPVLPTEISGPSSRRVGWSPAGVVGSDNTIYVANAGSNTVSVIDRGTGATTSIKVVGSPKAVALSPDHTTLYVGGRNGVSVIDTATNTVVQKLTLNGGQIYGLDVSADGTRVYVANNGKNTVSVVSTVTNTVVATIAVGSKPTGVALAGDRLYVANNGGGTLTVIDTAAQAVIGTVTVGSKPSELVADADGSRVYVTNYGSGTVSIIDTAAQAVIGTVTVGAKPQGIDLSADGTVLYVADGRDTVTVVDTVTRTVLHTVRIDGWRETGSHRLALSPDGSQIYITDMADHGLRTLTLIRGNTAPTAGTPTVGDPDTDSAAVTGRLNITDTDGDALSYTVTKAPTGGTLLIDAEGGYTFTPTQAARDAAAQTPGVDTVSFTVAAADGRLGVTTVSVTVPIMPSSTTVPGDSTGLLQSMFDALKPGDTLTLAPQTYQHSGVLTIRVPGVTIIGNGATLYATDDNTSSVQILADGVTLTDLTLAAALTGPRYYAPQHHKLVIMADHVTVTDVTVHGSAGAGIYIDNAGYFELNDVRVIRSRADGIHMTNGSHHGVVNNAYTEWTGDDGIAVVSYVPDVGGVSHDITINNPTVNGTTWGRGVSVVGGTDITYTNITVRDTDSAGVYIATEWSYNTRSVDGVRILGGTITNANTSATVVHGAVLVYAGNAGTAVRDVTFADLTIRDTPAGAYRILGMITENGATVSGITFRNLALYRSNTIAAAYTNAARTLYQLIDVTLNGVAVTTL